MLQQNIIFKIYQVQFSVSLFSTCVILHLQYYWFSIKYLSSIISSTSLNYIHYAISNVSEAYWQAVMSNIKTLLQQAQLPQRNSASAAQMEGAKHSSPLPLPPLVTPMRMVESETRNKRTSSVPFVKRTLSWIGHSRSFKVILICADRNPERCIVVMSN